MPYNTTMHIELTHDSRTGEPVYLFHKDGKVYALPKHLDRVNTVLGDAPSRKKFRAMELAIKLEQEAHQHTQERLNKLEIEKNVLDQNYQIAINTILGINDHLSARSINTLIKQLKPRKLILD